MTCEPLPDAMRLADGPQLFTSGAMTIDGDVNALARLAGLFDQFEHRFPIVTARTPW